MYYNLVRIPVVVKTGNGILGNIDNLLHTSHLFFSKKILVTQEHLYNIYDKMLEQNDFCKVIFVKGGM